jgi:integrase/recombinase XerD
MAKRKPKKLPVLLSEARTALILEAAGSGRDGLLLLLAALTGLRVSELSGLVVEDFDFAQESFFVREGKGQKDRCMPIPSRIKELLGDWIGDRQTGPLFPSPRGGSLKPRAIQLMIKRQALRAGIPKTELTKITPHKLRHFFATRLVQAGVPLHEVQQMLGHSSLSTTQVYLHTTPQRLKSAIDTVGVPRPPMTQRRLF